MIQVIRAFVAEGEALPAKSISTENLFGDVHRQLIAWTEMITPEQTVELMNTTWTASLVWRGLRQLLRSLW
jgi:hypothetical protein